jgi:hypothetical protein
VDGREQIATNDQDEDEEVLARGLIPRQILRLQAQIRNREAILAHRVEGEAVDQTRLEL